MAFAGWFGLLATAFNLFPIGQLDGGHILYAVLGKRKAFLAGIAAVTVLAAAGDFVLAGLAVLGADRLADRPAPPADLRG